MASYTYDPEKIKENGRDRMRFELGDTIIDMGPITSPLCDEEYDAILSMNKNFKRAKLECLNAICMKMAYEVDTSTDGLSYSLSSRADRWREMYKEAKKDLQTGVPTVNPAAIYGKDEPHYFRTDLHANPYRR